jgi:hypothetical protein
MHIAPAQTVLSRFLPGAGWAMVYSSLAGDRK